MLVLGEVIDIPCKVIRVIAETNNMTYVVEPIVGTKIEDYGYIQPIPGEIYISDFSEEE